MTADAAGEALVPHWLTAGERAELDQAVPAALWGTALHPVAAIHLGDVVTELQVAAARELVWPDPIERVRRATGWGADVVPVRLSAPELDSVLAVAQLSATTRAALSGHGSVR